MNRQKGFSLIELMIAITLGIVLMTGVVQMFVSSKTVFITQQGLSRLQETGRLAIEFMSRDIRQAGFMGCMYATPWNVISTLDNQNQFGNDFSFDNSIRVFDAPAGLPAGMDLDPAPKADTQVIAVYTANEESVSVTDATGNGTYNDEKNVYTDLTTAADEDCPSGICTGDIVAAADCEKAWIFQVTSASDDGSIVTLVHEEGSDPGNSLTSWGGNPDKRTQSLNEGAEVFQLNTVVYYIAENDEGRPGLYQQSGGDPAFELLRGVERINVEVGVDTDSDRVADQFVEPDDDTNWANVVATRLDVLVQTPDDNVASEKQTYEFAGEEKTAEDRRIRQSFSTTIAIRSKLP